VAGLASHVRTNSPQRTIGQQMAAPRPPGANARISGLRFRRLLAVSEREELYPLLIRALALLDGSVNLVALANGVFWWNEKTKKTWAYAYYETSPSEK
jgi:CRISPR system Cascade subunit CasB